VADDADSDAERPHLIGGRGVRVVIAALTGLLLLSLLIGISIGTVTVPFGEIWRIVGYHLGVVSEEPDPIRNQIVWEFRTPRVLLAAVVGAGLSVTGACLQVLARNGLADPYVLGVSSGASLGAVIVVAYGSSFAGGLGVSGAAFVASMITLVVVFAFAQRAGRVGPTRLVLAGVAVSYLVTAATSFVQLSVNPSELRGVLFWLLGSLAGAGWADLRAPTAAIVVSMVWLLLRARAMNAMTTGDDTAGALGVDVHRLRIELLVISSLLTGAAVSVAGGIGFVGLMVPHAARFVVGPDHRNVLPVSMVGGALFMVLVDMLSRMANRPNELPVGIFTAAIGAPFFLLLLRRANRVGT
jgi:iron complex transport system permease protein